MNEEQYKQLFEQLKIAYAELPVNYNPETYGKFLMHGAKKDGRVAYSADTIFSPNEYSITGAKRD